MSVHPPVTGHCDELQDALASFRASAHITQRWGEHLAAVLTGGGRLLAAGNGGSAAQAQHLAAVLTGGGRLLAAGNGGSAAQAQHLTAELVGRYRDDRPAFSAIALHADTSSTTAIANDYGVDEVFARQVRAHGRPGDVLMLLSTSGASANLLSAADAARAAGVRVWALTGPAPNPLMAGSDESLCVEAPTGATVQELHLVAVHMVCEAFDAAVENGTWRRRDAGRRDGDGRQDGHGGRWDGDRRQDGHGGLRDGDRRWLDGGGVRQNGHGGRLDRDGRWRDGGGPRRDGSGRR